MWIEYCSSSKEPAQWVGEYSLNLDFLPPSLPSSLWVELLVLALRLTHVLPLHQPHCSALTSHPLAGQGYVLHPTDCVPSVFPVSAHPSPSAVLLFLGSSSWNALLMTPRCGGRRSLWEPQAGCRVCSSLLGWPLFPGLFGRLCVCVHTQVTRI